MTPGVLKRLEMRELWFAQTWLTRLGSGFRFTGLSLMFCGPLLANPGVWLGILLVSLVNWVCWLRTPLASFYFFALWDRLERMLQVCNNILIGIQCDDCLAFYLTTWRYRSPTWDSSVPCVGKDCSLSCNCSTSLGRLRTLTSNRDIGWIQVAVSFLHSFAMMFVFPLIKFPSCQRSDIFPGLSGQEHTLKTSLMVLMSCVGELLDLSFPPWLLATATSACCPSPTWLIKVCWLGWSLRTGIYMNLGFLTVLRPKDC